MRSRTQQSRRRLSRIARLTREGRIAQQREPAKHAEELLGGPQWWRDLVDAHLRWLVRKGRRPNTIATYQAQFQLVGQWLTKHRVESREQLTRDDIAAWQDSIQAFLSP